MVTEAARVDGVHRGELPHREQVDRGLHDVGEGQPGRREDRLQVVEDSLDGRLDSARNQLARRGIERDLSEANRKPPSVIAWEYGPIAFGAASVAMVRMRLFLLG